MYIKERRLGGGEGGVQREEGQRKEGEKEEWDEGLDAFCVQLFSTVEEPCNH